MIIILTQCFPSRVGGIETLMYDIALNLSLKHDVKVLADQQDSAKDLEFDKNNKNFSEKEINLINLNIFVLQIILKQSSLIAGKVLSCQLIF